VILSFDNLIQFQYSQYFENLKKGVCMNSLSVQEIAARLVGFRTVSNEHSTREISQWIANYLEQFGFMVELSPYREKFNLLATIGGKTEVPRLAFAGHMDTVPCKEWDGDPFELKLKDGNWYGRGIADMKGFLAIAIKAAEKISSQQLAHPFSLCFTSDEEVGCLGAKDFFSKRKGMVDKRVAEYVVIGEPTSNYPIYLHKGYIWLNVSASVVNSTGKDNPVHSSSPETATNIVEVALPIVISELSNIKRRLETVREVRFECTPCSYPSMNIGGDINIGRYKHEDGKGKNIIPLGFSVSCEIRHLPGQDARVLSDVIQRVLQGAASDIRCRSVLNERVEIKVDFVRGPTEPMETPLDSLVVKAATEISSLEPRAVCFNTEGGIFNLSGSQSVIWGPSDIAQAHAKNESVPKDVLTDGTVERYVRMINEFCSQGGKYV
jgi:acetylornithine deacetylase